MAKTVNTASNNIAASVVASIAAEIARIKKEAGASVAALDNEIRAKQREHDTVTRRVTVDAFVQRVVGALRERANEHERLMAHAAATACHLSAHRTTRRISAYNGDGRPDVTESRPQSIELFSFDTPAVALLAIAGDALWPAIESWARQQAIANGCAETGADLDTAQARAEAIMDELIELHEQRAEAEKALASMIDMKLAPLAPPPPAPQSKYVEDRPPTVTVTMPDGSKREQVETYGHSLQEQIGLRVKQEQAEYRTWKETEERLSSEVVGAGRRAQR